MTQTRIPYTICATCELPVVSSQDEGLNVPCSEYHQRCIRCAWPVAKSVMPTTQLCPICTDYAYRKRYGKRIHESKAKIEEARETGDEAGVTAQEGRSESGSAKEAL